MEAKDASRRESQNHRSDGTVRSHQAGQLGAQSVGVQAGVGIFKTLGELDIGCLYRSVVLHHQ